MAYSMPLLGLGASMGLGGDDCISTSSSGVDWGVGDRITVCVLKYGCLCGNGEISMRSFNSPGEEDGMGGVVTHSRATQLAFLPHH